MEFNMIVYFDSGIWYCRIKAPVKTLLGYSPDRQEAVSFALDMLCGVPCEQD